MNHFFSFFQLLLVLILIIPLSLIPSRLIVLVGGILGRIAFSLWKSRREIALEGIRQSMERGCLPATDSPEKIALESFRHLGRSFAEIIKLYAHQGEKILDSVTVEGLEHYQAAAALKKGILVLTGHFGNWELLALYFSRFIAPGSVVARKQDNVYLNYLIEKVRAGYGNTVIYKKGALRNIMRELNRGKVVGILYDQSVLEREGELVNFLCRKAWTMKMPVLLSQRTGAPILPVFITGTATGHKLTIHKPFLPDHEKAIQVNLAILNAFLEQHIIKDPAQWLWIHRRWKRTDF